METAVLPSWEISSSKWINEVNEGVNSFNYYAHIDDIHVK